MNIGAFGARCEPPDAERHVRWCGRWGLVTVSTYPMMPIPVLTAEDIERLLPMRECITVMEQAFADLQRGFLRHPRRTFWAPPGVNGGTMWMAAHRSLPKPMFGTKLLF